MLRRLRRLLLLAILALVAGGAVLFLTTRPRLDDRRAVVAHDWTALQANMRSRVGALTALDRQIVAAGPLRDPSRAAEAALRRWGAGGNLASQLATANDLEGAGRRLVVLALDPNRRYHSIKSVTDAVGNYTTSALPRAGVLTLDAAIARYDDARRGQLFSIVADILGDEAIPQLMTSS